MCLQQINYVWDQIHQWNIAKMFGEKNKNKTKQKKHPPQKKTKNNRIKKNRKKARQSLFSCYTMNTREK